MNLCLKDHKNRKRGSIIDGCPTIRGAVSSLGGDGCGILFMF